MDTSTRSLPFSGFTSSTMPLKLAKGPSITRTFSPSSKRTSTRKFFPGYILVKMLMDDRTWHLVKSTPKVTGFVGSGAKPVPLPPEEVESILRQMEEGAEKPKLKSTFQKGDKVRVIEGPFVNFQGTIDDLNPERGKLKVMVAIFGRLTSVELEYYQVERL